MKRVGIVICVLSTVFASSDFALAMARLLAEPPKKISNFSSLLAQYVPEPGQPSCAQANCEPTYEPTPSPSYEPPSPPPYRPPSPPPPTPAQIANRLNDEGIAAYRNERWAAAIARFQQALKIAPSNKIRANLADAQAHRAWSAGDLELALKNAREMLALNGPGARNLVRDIAADWKVRIDARLSGIPRDKQLIIKQLGAMKTQFQSISNDYAGITAEALSAQQQAITQYNNMMTEVSDALVNEFLVLPEGEWSRREEEHIEKTLERVKEYRDVRKAKLPEIKANVWPAPGLVDTWLS